MTSISRHKVRSVMGSALTPTRSLGVCDHCNQSPASAHNQSGKTLFVLQQANPTPNRDVVGTGPVPCASTNTNISRKLPSLIMRERGHHACSLKRPPPQTKPQEPVHAQAHATSHSPLTGPYLGSNKHGAPRRVLSSHCTTKNDNTRTAT